MDQVNPKSRKRRERLLRQPVVVEKGEESRPVPTKQLVEQYIDDFWDVAGSVADPIAQYYFRLGCRHVVDCLRKDYLDSRKVE